MTPKLRPTVIRINAFVRCLSNYSPRREQLSYYFASEFIMQFPPRRLFLFASKRLSLKLQLEKFRLNGIKNSALSRAFVDRKLCNLHCKDALGECS